MLYFILFMTGASFGSFLLCFAERYSLGASILIGRSHCPACGHVLCISDLIPVFSYIMHKGRCRYCHRKIDIRYLLSEVLGGCLFLAVFYYHKVHKMDCFYAMAVGCILMGLSMTDLLTYEIPDRFHVMLITLWLIKHTILQEETIFLPFLLGRALSGLILSFYLFFLTFVLSKIRHAEMMGGGDIKLFFSVGLYLGFYRGMSCLFLSCVFGLFAMLVTKRKNIPFGPCISLSFLLLLLAKC